MKDSLKRENHWQKIYDTKSDNEVSWYQDKPVSSLELIESLDLSKNSKIINVGAGNSNLTAELQKRNFNNLSVLDISANALKRSRDKLKENGDEVDWIATDILDFEPELKYDLWHDRATFHFLINDEDVQKYINILSSAVGKDGYFVLATFSESGPPKCSGLEIQQYSKDKLEILFGKYFKIIKSFDQVHQTPFGTEQNFIYNLFQRI
jgi:ubiquinone/menaquinone biosynthesis C-methylase UbiE